MIVVLPGDDVLAHDPPYLLDKGRTVQPVWERAERSRVLRDAVLASGLPTTSALPHDQRLWRRVHDPDLVDWLRDGHAAWVAAGGPPVLVPDTFAHRGWAARRPSSPIGVAGWWLSDTATPVVAGSWRAAVAAVDAALTAVDLVLDGGHRAAHALTRPPGHHAGRDHLGGFCLVNHAAIAATALRERLGRVAVLDVDHHHGNGTQQLFAEDERVLYCSLHADTVVAYPWFTGHADEVGTGDGHGTTLNLPLPLGTSDDDYLAALGRASEQVAAHDPAALVVSLGTDTAATDPVGGLGLSPDAYPRIGEALAALDLPTVSVHEGGYDLRRIGADTLAVLRALP